VSRADRELVTAIRMELAAIDPTRPCDRRAEASALATAPANRQRDLARTMVRLGKEIEAAPPFEWEGAAEHCRLAWLRGVFLAHGSLSLASGRAHLEFVMPAADAAVLADRLRDVGLPASIRARRGAGVVTWKSADTIGTFLRRIGGGAALLELEARQVSRAVRGDLNRVVNAESANLQRAVLAAGRQLASIDVLDADGRLSRQPYTVRLVADARRDTPEATLTELAERLEINRSAVQRALERIEHLATYGDGEDMRPG
jgi:DNA-binding protein WhiA